MELVQTVCINNRHSFLKRLCIIKKKKMKRNCWTSKMFIFKWKIFPHRNIVVDIQNIFAILLDTINIKWSILDYTFVSAAGDYYDTVHRWWYPTRLFRLLHEKFFTSWIHEMFKRKLMWRITSIKKLFRILIEAGQHNGHYTRSMSISSLSMWWNWYR